MLKSALENMKGLKVILFCNNYFYSGVLVNVLEKEVVLTEALIVYETGAFTDKKFKDAQPLYSKEWIINKDSIESYGCLEPNKMISKLLLGDKE